MTRVGPPLLLVLVLAAAGQSAQLTGTTRAFGNWESNARNSATDSESATNLLGGVDAVLQSERNLPLTWSLNAGTSYQHDLRDADFDNWRANLSGDLRYQRDEATTWTWRARYDRYSHSGVSQADQVPEGPVLVEQKDEYIERFSIGGGLEHMLSRRWSSGFDLGHSLVRYSREDLSDSDSSAAQASFGYQLSRRQSLGFGLRLSRDVVDSSPNNPSENTTDFANLFGSWSYALSPLWSMSLRAGPTLVRSQRDSFTALVSPFDPRCPNPQPGQLCPIEIGEDTQNSTTLFGSAQATRRGLRTQLSLFAQRSEGGSFGENQSTVANTAGSVFSWIPSEKWRLSLRSTWSQRTSATDDNTGGDIDIETLSLGLSATRRLTRQLSGSLNLIWIDQQDNSTGEANQDLSSFENLSVSLGLIYQFRPLPL